MAATPSAETLSAAQAETLAAAQDTSGEVLARCAHVAAHRTFYAILRHPNMDPAQRERLAARPPAHLTDYQREFAVLIALTEYDPTARFVTWAAEAGTPKVRGVALAMPSADPRVVERVATRPGSSLHVHAGLVASPHTPDAIRQTLLDGGLSRSATMRMLLAQRADLPAEDAARLEPYLATCAATRRHLASNPATPVHLLAEIATRHGSEHDIFVRLARNPSTPSRVLSDLVPDPNTAGSDWTGSRGRARYALLLERSLDDDALARIARSRDRQVLALLKHTLALSDRVLCALWNNPVARTASRVNDPPQDQRSVDECITLAERALERCTGVHPDNAAAREALEGTPWWTYTPGGDEASLLLMLYPNP